MSSMNIGNAGMDLTLSQMQSNLNTKKVSANELAGAADGTDQIGDTLGSFGDLLSKQMNQINALQENANSAVMTYSTGGNIELHNVVLAVEKADMAMQLAVQVRNKLVSAYQELSHMQI